jgi:hypothetical protein
VRPALAGRPTRQLAHRFRCAPDGRSAAPAGRRTAGKYALRSAECLCGLADAAEVPHLPWHSCPECTSHGISAASPPRYGAREHQVPLRRIVVLLDGAEVTDGIHRDAYLWL